MPSKSYDKHKVLEFIFNDKTANGTAHIGSNIDFTLDDVGKAINATGGKAPTSYSNFVLDLTRKKASITHRLPQSVINYGYDLRKKTGRVNNSKVNYCGTFVYRGFDANGNTIPINDWLVWGNPDRTVTINNSIPPIVQKYLSNDEASLISAIIYCDILSNVLNMTVYLIQSPMKWQPNEIDGYFVSQTNRNTIVYPLEAKAVSTNDDINLVQMYGQYKTFIDKYSRGNNSLIVRPIAAKMLHDGMLLALLENNPLYNPLTNPNADMFNVRETIHVILNPVINSWQ